MQREAQIFLVVGLCFLFISIGSLRTRAKSEAAWANKLVLPPRLLAPAFQFVPSIHTDPRVVPLFNVFFFWFSIAWVIGTLALPFDTPRVEEFALLVVGLIVSSLGIGGILALVVNAYWPYRGT